VLIVLAVALIAALAYAFTGSSGSSPAPASSVPATSGAVGIAAVAAPPNANQSVAETTSGATQQHGGATRNPFAPLPGSATTHVATTSASAGSSGSSSAGKSSSGGSAESHPSSGTPGAPKQPAKQRVVIHFHTSVTFGAVPPAPAPGVPRPAPQLKTYHDLKLNEALPSKHNSQLVYLGVVLRTGKSAVFELTGEAIIHGAGKCLPSATHCEAIELQPGQAETLESIEPNGTPVTYQLTLVSISRTVTAASAARAHVATRGLSKVQRALVRRLSLAVLASVRSPHAAGEFVSR